MGHEPTGLHRPHCLPYPLGQPVSCWQQVPTDSAWGARQGQLARLRLELWSTGHSRAAGKGVPGGCRGEAWGGEGRICLGLTCYTQVGPCLTLPQFAFLWNGRRRATLETEGPGGGLEPSFAGGSHLQVVPQQRGPWSWLLAPVLPTWAPGSLSQRFGLWEWRRAGARPGHGHQASEGGLPYLQVLSPHVHCRKG